MFRLAINPFTHASFRPGLDLISMGGIDSFRRRFSSFKSELIRLGLKPGLIRLGLDLVRLGLDPIRLGLICFCQA